MAIKKTRTTEDDIQEVRAIIAVDKTTTNQEETAFHVAEATMAMAGVEVTTPVLITETITATQEVRQRHQLGPKEEVIEDTIEKMKEEVT